MSDEPSLIVPFVCVRSIGGPYDDESFAAGVQYGGLRDLLKQRPGTVELTVRAALREQLDLLAMECGYSATFTDPEEEPMFQGGDWLYATFKSVTP